MAKILTDKEMLQIVNDAISSLNSIDDEDQYLEFLDDLGKLIGKHFGADIGGAGKDEELGYCMAFRINEDTPPDGGVFKDYDMDVTWEDGKEIEPEPDMRFWKIEELMSHGNDSSPRLYVCKAPTLDDAFKMWADHGKKSETLTVDCEASPRPTFTSESGCLFYVYNTVEISESSFDVLKEHVTELLS